MCLKLGCSGMGRWGRGGLILCFFSSFIATESSMWKKKRGTWGDTWTHTHNANLLMPFLFFSKILHFELLLLFRGRGSHCFFFCLVFSLWAPWLNTCSHRAAPSPHVDLAKLKRKATTGKRKRHLKRHCVVFGYIWIFMIFTRNWNKLWTELTRGRS